MLGQSAALGVISWLYPQALSLNFIYGALAVILFVSSAFYASTLPRLLKRQPQEAVAGEMTTFG